jgi:hypothetical protein
MNSGLFRTLFSTYLGGTLFKIRSREAPTSSTYKGPALTQKFWPHSKEIPIETSETCKITPPAEGLGRLSVVTPVARDKYTRLQ